LDSTQFELTGVGIAVKGVPIRVRQVVIIMDSSTDIETLDEKVFIKGPLIRSALIYIYKPILLIGS
jgi:hypothetical protein